MTCVSALALTVLLAAAAPAAAQAERPAPRYVFVPVDNGALRLNTATGEVSLCSGEAAGTCALLADEARARREELAGLKARLAALEARLADLEAGGKGETLSDAESMDRVMLLTDRMMRRFFGMVRDMKNDLESGDL